MENVAQSQSAGLQVSDLSKEQVSALVNDKELRQLKPGTAEYTAAYEKKFSNKTTPVSATGNSGEKVETKTNSEVKTPASGETKTETVDEDREGLSKRAQKRIDQLTAKHKAADAENATLKTRLAELEAAAKPKADAKAPAKAEPATDTSAFDKPKPKVDDFSTFSDFQEALTDWKFDKREFDKSQAANAKTHQDKVKTSFDKFRAAGSELETELGLESGDFDHTVQNEDFKMFDVSREALLESEFGSRIAFEIASDEEQTAAFSKMSPAQQLKYIGKQEAKFEAQAKVKETKTVSSAKAPAKPLHKASPSATVGFDFKPGMSVKDYEAQRRERRAALGKK